ncbi:MAG: MFS transporter [Alphaproteobacteria bacterium]|nr:MFS transporter [Alphaproteobacteria bacterium]
MSETPSETHRWHAAIAALWDRRTLTLFFLGMSAGLPLLLIFSTLSIWLTEAGVPRADVTFFSWAALGYGFKFVWAPLVDRIPLPVLGRRRSWLLLAQVSVAAALIGMGLTDPAEQPVIMALWAVMLGFSAATQDIVIDAYRIEIAEPAIQAMLSAAYIGGYRVGMILAGAGALEIAGLLDSAPDGYDYASWRATYLVMAATMGLGVITTLLAREPDLRLDNGQHGPGDYARFFLLFLLAVLAFVVVFSAWSRFAMPLSEGLSAALGPVGGFLSGALQLGLAVAAAVLAGWGGMRARIAPRDLVIDGYVSPFRDFVGRFGGIAVSLLCLIALYRMADVVMGVVANVFYTDLGFEKEEIGRITKLFGLVVTILGGFVGGILTIRFGVFRILFLGALLSAATNILFAFLATRGADTVFLAMAVSADNLSAGLASAAFVAFLSSLTDVRFTAMQYAMISSLMLLVPKLVGGYSGAMVDAAGYEMFFIGTAIVGLPVCALVLRVARHPAFRASGEGTDATN